MSLFQESCDSPGGRAALLSIKPKYADLILAGSKRIELRRAWPDEDIGVLVLYSSAPVQRLVGIAYVDHVRIEPPDKLWELAQQFGGGVTHDEFCEYFRGKRKTFGIMLKSAEIAEHPIDPKEVFTDFSPPQSYMYIDPLKYHSVFGLMFPSRSSK
ncbi:ASCH domain-containing protein [Comamonas testosteroni]|uniref:ASCH domain-containing protein n=1 Tax=Comamonas testosteroni TaxID=285 RepID=UPI00391DB504